MQTRELVGNVNGLTMDLVYVCEWDKRTKSNHCPSIPLVCAWSCRNLIAFTTDLKNEDEDKGGVEQHTRTPDFSAQQYQTVDSDINACMFNTRLEYGVYPVQS